MLQPNERSTLLDALAPPEGYELEIAVGTTFTLNLLTLITTPWAFAVYEAMAAREDDDPHEAVGLLDAVRRHADRITVFCQTGQIAVGGATKLMPLMDASVVPVSAPRGGLFHPKFWVLGFIDDRGRRLNRLLIASRNLTTDRSWDTLLRIDQAPDGVSLTATGVLLRWLAGQCTTGAQLPRGEQIRAFAGRLARVRWAVPDGYESMTLHAMGLPRGTTPTLPTKVDRLVAISPFATVDRLDTLPASPARTLISSPETLDGLPTDLAYHETFTLDRDAAPPDVPGGDLAPADPATALVGLHAKIVAFDHGWDTTLVTGSANLTTAGWSSNVEVMATLTGRKSRVGTHTIIDPQPEQPCLRDLLTPYEPGQGDAQDDPLAGDGLDDLRRRIAAHRYTADITTADDGTYLATLRTVDAVQDLWAEIDASYVWPLMFEVVKSAPRFDDAGRLQMEFRISRLADLSSFFAIQLQVGVRDTAVTVVAELRGLPDGRDRAVLTGILAEKDRLLRYLLLLLARAGDHGALLEQVERLEAGAWQGRFGIAETPLLEALLRAASRGPAKLATFGALLTDLGDDAERLLPEGFIDLWHSVQQATKGT